MRGINRIFGKQFLLHNKNETRAVTPGSEAFLPIGTTRVRKWYNAVTVLIWRPKFLLSKDGTDESSRPAHGSLTTNCQYARRPVLAAGNGQGRFVHRKIDGLSSRAIRA